MASYLPSRDAELGQWVTNFSTLVSAAPGTYGLVAGDATAIATYVNAFTAALAVVNNPATKTKATVANKDGAKAAMLEIKALSHESAAPRCSANAADARRRDVNRLLMSH